MGLDISIVVTPKELDLEKLYAVLDAVENGFYWYLGDDQGGRAEKWKELKAKCQSLTKEDVLRNISGPEDLVKCLDDMSDSDFEEYMGFVFGSIAKHEDGNTHLFFNRDKLPGWDVFDSCSWNLRDLFLDCKKDGRTLRPCGDFVCELDPYRIWDMERKWQRKSFKFWLAKWIGYFSERVGFNILGSCLNELGVKDSFVDIQEVEYYKSCMEKVVRETKDTNHRIWLVSSY